MDQLPLRDLSEVDLIVLHCTEEPDLEDARKLGEDLTKKIAAHYYVDRDGSVEQWIDPDRVASHTRGVNRRAIGIELVNLGRWPDHFSSSNQTPDEPYTPAQLEALKDLLDLLRYLLPGSVELKRHSDLDESRVPATDKPEIMVRRRIDPGPLFPWERFLGRWSRTSPTNSPSQWSSPR